MNRASKLRAIEFIAANDNDGDLSERLDPEKLASYMSVLAIAAAWDQGPLEIAHQVIRKRISLDKESKRHEPSNQSP